MVCEVHLNKAIRNSIFVLETSGEISTLSIGWYLGVIVNFMGFDNGIMGWVLQVFICCRRKMLFREICEVQIPPLMHGCFPHPCLPRGNQRTKLPK